MSANDGAMLLYCRMRAESTRGWRARGDQKSRGLVHEVMIQQAAERRFTLDPAGWRGPVGIVVTQGDYVPDALMRSVLVVMALDSLEDVFQVRLADQNQIVECFPALADEPFRKGIALGRGRWRLHNPNSFCFEDEVERQEGCVTIMDKETDLAGRFVHSHAEIPRLLAHPVRIRIRLAARNANLAGLEVDEEQHVDGLSVQFASRPPR